jgi:TnsA endonuclease N terminal/TnsA endonuclease C terminal
MPVRKIPKNYLSVTGGYPSRKSAAMNGFESLLEKKFLMLLDFDETVEKFEVQPVRVPVPSVPVGYVPDVLVHYRPDGQTSEVRRPLLAEVKHTDDLKRHAKKYAPKFAAAHLYAEERGWEFRTVIETEIQTPRLANLKFLRAYRSITPSQTEIQQVFACLELGSQSSLQILLDGLAAIDEEKLYWLPIIWSMVLNGHLIVDLNQPFSNDLPIQLGTIAL